MIKNTILILLATVIFVSSGICSQDMVTIDEVLKIEGPRLVIDIKIDGGQIIIKKSDKDECHVYLQYNSEKSHADVQFDERQNNLEISVDYDSWDLVKKDGDNDCAQLILELPQSQEIDLITDIKAGEINFDLGGIHLKNFELNNLAGEVRIDFQESNKTDMNIFDVNCKVGSLELLHLGNANLSDADINAGIGELTIDFRGQKTKRTVARIDLDIGESTIIVPEDIGVKMKVSRFLFLSNLDYPNWFKKSGKYYYSKNYKDTDNSLYLMISSGIGELNIRME